MATARTEDARHKAAESEHTPGLKSFWIQSFIGITLVLLLSAMLLLYLWLARDAADQRRHLNGVVNTLAEHVTTDMARIRGVVDAWRTDPTLRAAFRRSGTPEALRQEEDGLLHSLPGALSVHLFAPEQTISVEGIPFMSFAGRDLARKAAQERTLTPIEVHKVGQPDMHLAVAVPVLDEAGERAVGVVHVALPMSLLPTTANAATGTGLILFQQLVGKEVANFGATAAPEARPDHTAPIGGTSLRLAGWLQRGGGLDFWLVGEVSASLLVVLGLIGGVLWLGYSAQERALLLDCKGFTILVEDAVHHRPLRRIRSRIAEVQGAHQETLTLLRSLRPARAPLRGSTAAPLRRQPEQPVSADDGLNPSSALSPASIEVEEFEVPEGLDPYSEISSVTLTSHPPPDDDSEPALLDPYSEPLPEPDDSASQSPLATLTAGLDSYGSPLGEVPAGVFRAHDIRGLVAGELTADAMRLIGQALGSEATARDDRELMVGRDRRASSATLSEALIAGIRRAGPAVVDLGLVPTPLVYFACCHPQPTSGAMVTASHNPEEYNGLKMMLHGASTQSDDIQGLRQRILVGEVTTGNGGYRRLDIAQRYCDFVAQDVTLARGLKLAIDCGNAAASTVAPALFRALGCEVIAFNCELDSDSPELPPDPAAPERSHDLSGLVTAQQADLGLAFDSDGNRLGVIDSLGRFIAADRVLMFLAADVLSRHPGTDVIYDVMCSRHLAEEIRRAGGRPIMWRCGHGALKARLREGSALIAGSFNGNIIYKERWLGFDDALYAGARLLEVLSLDPRPTSEIFAALPGGLATAKLTLPLAEGEAGRIMRSVMQMAGRLEGVEVIRIDGLRAEFERGFGVVRASETQPHLIFRFEGDDAEALEKIKTLFRRLMEKAARGIAMPF